MPTTARIPRATSCLALLVFAGCGARPARVDVEVAAAGLDAAAVAAVQVAVSAADGPPFEPFTVLASRRDGSWLVSIGSVPAGAGRVFSVEALDGASLPVLAGSARVDVAPEGLHRVTVLLQPLAVPAPAAASAPILNSVSVWNAAVAPGGRATLQADARDPASAPLQYRWAAAGGCGTLSDPSVASTYWYADAVPPLTTCPIGLTVTSLSGASVQVFVPIEVVAATP